jgi:hypothetical protein
MTMAISKRMSSVKQPSANEGDNQMNTNRQTAVAQNESRMKITGSKLIRWAGLSAMVAGTLYVIVGIFHPVENLSSLTTSTWAIVHSLAVAMSFFGLLGITGIYARQVEEAGWLGLIGFVLLSLWLVILTGFTFTEVFVLPLLATTTPVFAESFLGIFISSAGKADVGALPTLWMLTGPLYILGGLLFGIATFRAAILSRWAAGLLAVGAALAPAAALLPHENKSIVAVPVGLALAWLGYALWSERRTQASEPVPGMGKTRIRQTAAE